MDNSQQPTQLIPTAPPDVPPTQPIKKSPMRAIWITFGLIALVMTTSGVTAGMTAYLLRSERTATEQAESALTSDMEGVAVVEKVSDSVVSITTQTVGLDWFGRQVRAEGAGSGFILTEAGYILTNNHVVEGAQTVVIVTSEDESYQASVVATEPAADLALLKAEADVPLTPVTLGDSDSLRVGEEVYAIGNALGQYPNSVTQGIVSGLGRPITASGGSGLRGDLQEFEDLIQTDAAINSGNSGGPLVNGSGDVIGINTAVAGQAQNIGFSVPINRAQALIERALAE